MYGQTTSAGASFHAPLPTFDAITAHMDSGGMAGSPARSTGVHSASRVGSPGMESTTGGGSSVVVMTALSTLRARIRNLEAEKAAGRNEASRLQAALADERARHAAQVKDLETAAQLDAARMRTTAGNLSAERGELEVKVVKLEAANAAIQRDLAFAQEQARTEMEDKRAQETRAAAAEARVTTLEQEVAQLTATMQGRHVEATRQSAAAGEQNAQLRRLVAQLQAALSTEAKARRSEEVKRRKVEDVLRGVVRINEDLVASLLPGAGAKTKSTKVRRQRLRKALNKTRALAQKVLRPGRSASRPPRSAAPAPVAPPPPPVVAAALDGDYYDEDDDDSASDNGGEDSSVGPAQPAVNTTALKKRRASRKHRERPWRDGAGDNGGGVTTTRRRSNSRSSKARSRRSSGVASGGVASKTSKSKSKSVHGKVVHANRTKPIPFLLGSSTGRSQNVYGALQEALASPAAYGADSAVKGTMLTPSEQQQQQQHAAPPPVPPSWDVSHTAAASAYAAPPPSDTSSTAAVVGIPVATAVTSHHRPPVAAVVAPAPAPHAVAGPQHAWPAGGSMSVSTQASSPPRAAATATSTPPKALRGGATGTFAAERDIEGVVRELEDEFRELNNRYTGLLLHSQVRQCAVRHTFFRHSYSSGRCVCACVWVAAAGGGARRQS